MSSVEKQRELEAWYNNKAAENNAKAWQTIKSILDKVDPTVYAKQYGKEVPQSLFIEYFNAKNKIADAERDIIDYQKLLATCRPAERRGIVKRIEQNRAYIKAYQDRIVEGFKGWFETYGMPFLIELLPKLDVRRDRMTLGVASKAQLKNVMDRITGEVDKAEQKPSNGEGEITAEEEEEPLT